MSMDQVAIDVAQGRWQAVEERCKRMLDGGDTTPGIRLFLAVALCQGGRFTEATQLFRQFLAAEPSSDDAWRNLGQIQFNENALDAAARSFNHAICANPEDKDAWVNLGYSLYFMAHFADAVIAMKRAAALFPDDALRSRVFYPLHRLGRFDEAWPLLALTSARAPAIPAWQGGDLKGKTLLVWSRGNSLGSEIFYASMIPDLIAAGARVVFSCQPRLVPLLARSFGAAHIAAIGDQDLVMPVPFPIDCQVHSTVLQAYCRPTLDSFASARGFLKADPAEMSYWRARLAALGPEPKVGISWRSGAAYNATYAFSLRELAPVLTVPGIQFVNIQYTDCRPELAAIRDEFGVNVANFEEINITTEVDRSAALIGSLDLVVSSENTSGHLACGLGMTCFTICPDVVLNGQCLPWFPSQRRFAKAWNESWAVPIAAAAATLRRWVEHRSATTEAEKHASDRTI